MLKKIKFHLLFRKDKFIEFIDYMNSKIIMNSLNLMNPKNSSNKDSKYTHIFLYCTSVVTAGKQEKGIKDCISGELIAPKALKLLYTIICFFY